MNADRLRALPSPPLEPAAADPGHALRDLMGLLTLPALWAGKDARCVLELMADAIAAVAPVVALYAEVHLPGEAAPTPLFKRAGHPWCEVQGEWRGFVDACGAGGGAAGHAQTLASPLGALQVVRLYMGSGRRVDRIWLASAEPAFPTLPQLAFMRAAVTLAATGVHSARMDHERERASRAKDEFLAMLGHELRNPLAPIVTALHLLRQKSGEPTEPELQVIERQVQSLSRLVDDLLDLTRITRDQIDLRIERHALRESVLLGLESVAPLIQQRRHHVVLDLDPLHGQVDGDRARLRQVFANIILNAAKYTPPGGLLTIEGTDAGDTAVVTVRDNGYGIDADLLPRVFDLFEQGKRTLDRADGGLGIGLALVKKLVTLHAGSVWADSAGQGRGALFGVRLPLASAPSSPAALPPAPGAAIEAAAAAQPARSAGVAQPVQPAPLAPRLTGSLLVVDDNVDALESLQALLRLEGYEVHAARNADEALAIAERHAPAICILDIGLPGIDGYELARLLRGGGRGPLRLIALTGYGQSADRERTAAAGFDLHFTKPVPIPQLLRALQ